MCGLHRHQRENAGDFVCLFFLFSVFIFKDPSALSRRDSLSSHVETNGIGACGAEQGLALHFVSTGQYFSSKCVEPVKDISYQLSTQSKSTKEMEEFGQI